MICYVFFLAFHKHFCVPIHSNVIIGSVWISASTPALDTWLYLVSQWLGRRWPAADLSQIVIYFDLVLYLVINHIVIIFVICLERSLGVPPWDP